MACFPFGTNKAGAPKGLEPYLHFFQRFGASFQGGFLRLLFIFGGSGAVGDTTWA